MNKTFHIIYLSVIAALIASMLYVQYDARSNESVSEIKKGMNASQLAHAYISYTALQFIKTGDTATGIYILEGVIRDAMPYLDSGVEVNATFGSDRETLLNMRQDLIDYKFTRNEAE